MEQLAVDDIPDIADVHLAHARIRARVRVTPVINDSGLDEALGCHLYCKCENLQRTGAFKFRGASNAIARLREGGRDGDVATHSSGNHGAALALAARLDGRTAHVVMPENSSRLKIAAVREYGGQIHFCAPTNEARAAELEKLVAAGMIPIHPYDNADIIAGQGTTALELAQTSRAARRAVLLGSSREFPRGAASRDYGTRNRLRLSKARGSRTWCTRSSPDFRDAGRALRGLRGRGVACPAFRAVAAGAASPPPA